MTRTARLTLYLTFASWTLAGCAPATIPSQVVATLGVPLEIHSENDVPGRCKRAASELRCTSQRLAPANLPTEKYEFVYAANGRLQQAYFVSAALSPADFRSVRRLHFDLDKIFPPEETSNWVLRTDSGNEFTPQEVNKNMICGATINDCRLSVWRYLGPRESVVLRTGIRPSGEKILDLSYYYRAPPAPETRDKSLTSKKIQPERPYLRKNSLKGVGSSVRSLLDGN